LQKTLIGLVDQLTEPSQGAFPQSDGTTEWCIWAPWHQRVSLVLVDRDQRRTLNMQRDNDGHFRLRTTAAPGQRYAYLLGDDRREYPDPVSRWQPDGVNQSSAAFDPTVFRWSDAGWRGISADALVIYELHVGTFTREGTFDAVIERLDELVELGITVIELMPIAQFPGHRNWGYDGVHPFAAQNTYGGPAGLQRLVDAAHRAGMAVILDVVYNHLGPEGNYFDKFGPYFTDRYYTPWGRALNYDGAGSDPVRKMVLDNAAMWIRDFHLDGLRLDAIQTIYDTSALHILAELQQIVEQIARQQKRHVTVIGETNQNDIRLVAPRADGGYGLDGIWADDFHHCVHALLTGERDGYYQDFGAPEHLAKALRDVFVYDGCFSPFHDRRHGNRVGDTAREKFVFCVQNHDQIGNRAMGDRLAATLSNAQLRLAAALLLLSPTTPLLFMGEEYGETRPFPFFCSFSNPELIAAVRRGRKAELASVKFKWQHEPPDPHDEQTFNGARLSWLWPNDPQQSGLRALYKDLLWARRAWFGDKPSNVTMAEIFCPSGDAPCLWFQRGASHPVQICANLSAREVSLPRQPATAMQLLLSTADEAYGGQGGPKNRTVLGPYECVVWGPANLQQVPARGSR
jgi:maltooligosyltrehalose trehalohydrolase